MSCTGNGIYIMGEMDLKNFSIVFFNTRMEKKIQNFKRMTFTINSHSVELRAFFSCFLIFYFIIHSGKITFGNEKRLS